ncbi:CBS domain protein [Thiogranum longum]|uniref:CBS domain protein n=2 Tax=Thiogranum longum TaxID=1537524 RepID=A0A4R1HPN7_9GAMM|nr:CBS domain protein [Thiogranum longum]
MAQSKTLSLHPLPPSAGYFEPCQEFVERVHIDSPAILAMTDLRQQMAVNIEPDVSIEWALQRMKSAGVRLLFVVNPDKQLLGLITSTDIQGEKPAQFRQGLNLRHEEIMVRDIMTPYSNLEATDMSDVRQATVGDVVAMLEKVGRRHALVLDRDTDSGNMAIRGIFSASQIEKQLDRVIETVDVALTFAEVESALNS